LPPRTSSQQLSTRSKKKKGWGKREREKVAEEGGREEERERESIREKHLGGLQFLNTLGGVGRYLDSNSVEHIEDGISLFSVPVFIFGRVFAGWFALDGTEAEALRRALEHPIVAISRTSALLATFINVVGKDVKSARLREKVFPALKATRPRVCVGFVTAVAEMASALLGRVSFKGDFCATTASWITIINQIARSHETGRLAGGQDVRVA